MRQNEQRQLAAQVVANLDRALGYLDVLEMEGGHAEAGRCRRALAHVVNYVESFRYDAGLLYPGEDPGGDDGER